MLDEGEWAEVQAAIYPPGDQAEWAPFRERLASGSAVYGRITGLKGVHPNVVAHHRASNCGPPCRSCGKPLRTPRAAFCAACGADVG